MTDVLVESFPISGLEYVFSPPGLPLVAKGSDSPGTTSILIRGGAGTGKTTLAVALAYAISRAQEGITLYLTTEFVATELVYKADTLGLPEDSVRPWASAVEGEPDVEFEPGTILAQHLLMTAAGRSHEQTKTVAGRKLATIEAMWELLARDGAEPRAELPAGSVVRAVVIDAFGLPEVDAVDHSLRSQLLELVQALEVVGITTILVEEAGNHAEAWLPFVVDVVFEIELWPDPDTGDLLRRLKCPKSRYWDALPGPHDYGVGNDGFLAVWPDLVLSADTHGALWSEEGNCPPAIFVPFGHSRTNYAVCEPGTVLEAKTDRSGSFGLREAFRRTPGIRAADVNCGPLTRIDGLGRTFWVSQGQGVYALAWELIRAHRDGSINAVLIQGIEFFLAYPRSSIRVLRMLSMLSAAGLTVCIQGTVSQQVALEPITDLVQDGIYRRCVSQELPQQFSYRADRWIVYFHELRTDETQLFDHAVRQRLLTDDSPRVLAEQLAVAVKTGSVDQFRLVSTEHLLGKFADPHRASAFASVLSKASFFLLIGDGLQAAQLATTKSEHPDFANIWSQLSAIYAANPFAIKALTQLASPSHPRETIMLMRALARINEPDQLATLIQSCGEWFDLPEWYLERLRLEYTLDNGEADALAAAKQDLTRLAESPEVHRFTAPRSSTT